jgi:hypothetical protein
MTTLKAAALLVLLAVLPACAASSLEQIVQDRREARLQQVNASRPLTHGAADGLGFSIADTAPGGLTVAGLPKQNP